MALNLKTLITKIIYGRQADMHSAMLFKQGDQNLLSGAAELKSGSSGWASGHYRTSGSGGTVAYNQTITPPSNANPQGSFPTKGITITATAANTMIGFCQDSCPSELKTITMSVWVKGNSGDKVNLQPIWSGTSGQEESGSQQFTLSDSDWHHLVYTKTPNYAHTAVSLGYVYYYGAAVNNVLYVMAPKIEYGDVSTYWDNNALMYNHLYTSFNNSEVIGSKELTSTTFSEIITEISQSAWGSPQIGSVYLGTAYSSNGDTIPVGWYNYITDYQNSTTQYIWLFGMTIDNQCYEIKRKGSSTYYIKRYVFSNIISKGNMTNGTTTYYSLNGTAGTHYYYVKSGNIVTVCFNVKCTTPASTWATFASGLPKNNAVHLSFPLACAAENKKPMWCKINNDGTIAGYTGVANNYYYGSFSYLTTDS